MLISVCLHSSQMLQPSDVVWSDYLLLLQDMIFEGRFFPSRWQRASRQDMTGPFLEGLMQKGVRPETILLLQPLWTNCQDCRLQRWLMLLQSEVDLFQR